MAPGVLASALESPVVTVLLVLVFSALIVIALTAVASGVLWLALRAIERVRGPITP